MNKSMQEGEGFEEETYVDSAWDLSTSAESVLVRLSKEELELTSIVQIMEQAAQRRQRRLQEDTASPSLNESQRQMLPFSAVSIQYQVLLPQ